MVATAARLALRGMAESTFSWLEKAQIEHLVGLIEDDQIRLV
jgi:hypothetical protein